MKNLGVDIIYVISRTEDFGRIHKLREELSFVENLNLEVIPAVTGESLPSISNLIEEKKLFPVFTDPIGLLTKNIIATALSHIRVMKTFNNSVYNKCLILEDDARLTSNFWKDYSTGGFDKFIKDSSSIEYDLIFWGRETYIYNSDIKHLGKVTDKLYKTFLNTNQYGAHAYQLSKGGVKKILNQVEPIKYAADVFLESCDIVRYSPKHCYFYQDRGDIPEYYKNKIRFYIDGVGTTGVVSNTRADINQNYETVHETGYIRNVRECKVFRDIPIEKITFPPRKLPNGNVVENWASIYLDKKS